LEQNIGVSKTAKATKEHPEMDAIVVEQIPGKFPKCGVYTKDEKIRYVDGMYEIGTILVVSKEYKVGTYAMIKVVDKKSVVFGMHMSLQTISLDDMLKKYFKSGMKISYKEFIRRQGKFVGYYAKKYFYEHIK